MKYIRRYLFSLFPLCILLLTALYFFTRTVLLKNLPIFVDEATHIHWAQLGFSDPNLRLVSLGDGKQPLFIWLIIGMMHILKNPLVAGRAAGILSGFGAAIGMMLLTYELFKNKWIALYSMFLYILCPFALIIDRITIYDSLVTLTALWSLYLSIRLVREIDLKNAFLLAFSLGAGVLNKSSGFLSIYTLPLTLLLFQTGKNKTIRFIKWVLYAVIAVSIAYLYYSILRLSSDFKNIQAKNDFFLNSPLSLLHSNFMPLFMRNMELFSEWILLLFSVPFLILTGIALLRINDYTKQKALLISIFVIEIIGLALLVRNPYPRYIFFMTMFLVPLASLGIWYIYQYVKKNIKTFLMITAVLISFTIYTDYKIITDLEGAPVPEITKVELVTGWPAGGGMSAIVKYLMTASQQQRIFVITDGQYGGMTPAVMDVYFFGNSSVDRMSIDAFPQEIPEEIIAKKLIEPVYLFLNQIQAPNNWGKNLLLKYQKGHGSHYVYLYQLK